MTAGFLLNVREWDHHMSNPETYQWDIHGGGNDHRSAIQFETRTMPWTINNVLGDDPLLKPVPVESEVNLQDRLPIGASALRAGY